ncbi:MAG: FliA/WhiG family RNA polymerase sigma factor [Thermomicrobiales bacterium]
MRRRQRDVVPDEGRGARLWEEYHLRPTTSLREDIVVQYAPLVRYVIGRLALRLPTGMDHEDLLGYGTIGLIEAVDRFDPTRGVKFETYAIQRIRGSIIDQLRRMDPVTRGIRQKATQIERAMSAISMEQGRTPEDEEVADRLDMSLEEYHRVLRESNIYLVPLDGGPRGEDDVLLIDTIVDEDSPDPVEVSIDQEMIRLLADAIDDLPERDQLILKLYHFEQLTLKEIGQVLDVTESRVSQLHSRAVLQLRSVLNRETESNAEAAGVST